MPPGPPGKSPPPVGASGYGGGLHNAPVETRPRQRVEYHLQHQPGPDKKSLAVVTKEKAGPRGEDIIRDTKLRVYQRHYETVLNAAIEARLNLLDAVPEKQESLKARQAALEEIAGKLEEDIRQLSGAPRTGALRIEGGGAMMSGTGLEGTVIKETRPGPGGGAGTVELRDGEGNTLRLTEPRVER